MSEHSGPEEPEHPRERPPTVMGRAKKRESRLTNINDLLLVLVVIAAFGFPWILVMLLPLDTMGSVLESE